MIVDIIIIVLVLLSTFLAYRKGLVSLAISLCTVVIAILIAVVLYKPVTNVVINVTNIDETIQNVILEKANDIMQEEQNDTTISNEIYEAAKNGMLPEASRNLAINIVTAGVIFTLFIITKLLLKFVSVIANAIAELPIINQFNKFGGIIYGILRGLLMVYIVLLMINLFSQLDVNNDVNNMINNSYIAKTMYENNVLKILL